MKISHRQNAKERRMERRLREHPRGQVIAISRRVSYPAAIEITRECRAEGNRNIIYVPAASGTGWNVLQLEAK